MRNKKVYSIFLMGIFAAIMFFVAISSENLKEIYKVNILSQGLYHDNSIYFSLAGNGIIRFDEIFRQKTNFILYKDNLSLTKDVRGVYHKGNIVVKDIPMLEGRFFKEEDYYKNKKVAVVGKDILEDTIQKGKERYYNFGGVSFKVIGVIGSKVKSDIDRICLLNMDAVLKYTNNVTGRYVLDSLNRSRNISIYKSVLSAINTNPQLRIRKLDIKTNGLKRFYRKSFSNIVMYILVLISIIISSISISLFWIEKNKKTIAAFRLVGQKDVKIKIYIIMQYIKYSTMGYLIGITVFIIFTQIHLIKIEGIYAKDIIIFVALAAVAGLFVVIFPLKQAMKVTVKDIMR